ncbi:CDP-alcohol phosphatidyltransferase family protein [Flavobacterium sp. HJJ]|uniref:CDP-alcohol phosphatidyltransferase family protein n=1 Tax=Flavobacterium sp. HJJ TaxID=2783792 RepID=UPI00188B3556|nr:CDP-alcohol phosphatidyltransferase family protein [Flavobacterium sp. HJJ]MBF4472469.1 CDP-alcohol phosphatidyltransferase family protein [Flavobacterium sp. HJJ]
MPKLAPKYQFLDLSDYGRPLARLWANWLKNTRFTPIHVTLIFGVSGLIAIYCILQNHYFTASFFLILKSIIDAVDGELARVKKTPSYSGRYLDSIFDIILNFLIFMAICYISQTTFWLSLLAFIGIQLQGTLFNYYYVILRNHSAGGDATSQIFEDHSPRALPGESQKSVDILFAIYTVVYGVFDKIIHTLDSTAYKVKTFPNWFMTLVSLYGLGFQLLLIALLLSLNRVEMIAPFFVSYSVLILVLIGIRKVFIKSET